MRTRILSIMAGALFAALPFATAQALPDSNSSYLGGLSSNTNCFRYPGDQEIRSSCNRNPDFISTKIDKPKPHKCYKKWHFKKHKHWKKDWHKKWSFKKGKFHKKHDFKHKWGKKHDFKHDFHKGKPRKHDFKKGAYGKKGSYGKKGGKGKGGRT